MDEGNCNMIKTRLAYNGGDIYINPYTISYMTRFENETTIGFTNGHTYNVSASIPELLEVINNETKSLCKECTQGIPKS